MHPPFPEIGSVIGTDDKGSRFFCLGRLGKGTFCSIHKCVDLSYAHHSAKDAQASVSDASPPDDDGGNTSKTKDTTKKHERLVAAKAELANFVDSGVIDGEAAVLKFLDASLPKGMVPTYVDYVKQLPTNPSSSQLASVAAADGTIGDKDVAATGVSAIIMEYLPGEDMHLLRDRHCQSLAVAEKQQQAGSSSSMAASPANTAPRRLSVADAVYLVADVMLPLLKAMHEVGIVHRDVKPSNVVRTGTTASDRNFKIVDFGLSKSFVVPKDSTLADPNRPWKGVWMSPSFSTSMNNNDNINNISGGNISSSSCSLHLSKMEEQPKDMARGGCIRLERDCAEFRGTSMYASLRVHQGRDHCPRDDIWGLLYVFCDLVSGGLPWMSHAAARDRSSCQILKEMVMGERGREDWAGAEKVGGGEGEEGSAAEKSTPATAAGGGIGAGKPNPEMVPKNGEDAMEWLLFGAEYHMAKYKRDKLKEAKGASATESEPQAPLTEPLSLAKNEHFVSCLRRAFKHVATLGFVEMPDYDLIEQCLRGFLQSSDSAETKDDVPSIDWKDRRTTKRRRSTNAPKIAAIDTGGVSWDLLDADDADPLDDTTLMEAENDRRAALEAAAAAFEDAARANGGGGTGSSAGNASVPNTVPNLDPGSSLSGEAADLARLPLQMQFCLSQVEYNAQHPDTIPLHLALRDWMSLAVPLAHGTWDAASWERGNHRTDDDGYRNEVYMSMLQKCLDAAEPFNGFADKDCFYYPSSDGANRKRRRVGTSAVPQLVAENDNESGGGSESPLLVVSRVFFLLRLALDMEKGKNFAPPPQLSFGFVR